MTRASMFAMALALQLSGCQGLYRDFDRVAPSIEGVMVFVADASTLNGPVLASMQDAGASAHAGMVDAAGASAAAGGRSGAPGAADDGLEAPVADAGSFDVTAADGGGFGVAAADGGSAGATDADGGGSGALEPGMVEAAGAGGVVAERMPTAGAAGMRSVPRTIELPPLDVGFDYQVGKVYPPAASVAIVTRAYTEARAEGRYNICELSGFRVHESDHDQWLEEHPNLVLRDARGNPVIDQYSSLLIDVSSEAKRKELAAVVSDWIGRCAAAGFDAVAINDLDAYAESNGLIDVSHIVETMKVFAAIARAHQLAIGQKNASELAAHKAEMRTDFAIAEECNRYRECDSYRAAYNDHVLVLEYRRADFDASCAEYPELSTVLRDLTLLGPSDPGYVYDGC